LRKPLAATGRLGDAAAMFGFILFLPRYDIFVQAIEKSAHRRFQRLGQEPQAGGGDAIGATLIFLDLLEPYPYGVRDLLLGQAQRPTTLTQALTQVPIDFVRHIPKSYKKRLSQYGTD
jgi:hypothetical protein